MPVPMRMSLMRMPLGRRRSRVSEVALDFGSASSVDCFFFFFCLGLLSDSVSQAAVNVSSSCLAFSSASCLRCFLVNLVLFSFAE